MENVTNGKHCDHPMASQKVKKISLCSLEEGRKDALGSVHQIGGNTRPKHFTISKKGKR